MSVPLCVQAGTTITWSEVSEYASDGWSLAYKLRGPSDIDIDAVSRAGSFDVAISAAASGGFLPGRYEWRSYRTKAGDVYQVGSGVIEIEAFFGAANVDPRSETEKIYYALEATILGRATKDQQSYEIEGRRLDRIRISDLERLKRKYKRLLNEERRRKSGRPRPVFKTRFNS